VPRFRQKLATPPLQTGLPFWVDDPSFNLTYHLRHTALPEPGGEDELRRLAGRVFSQQLDRSKPLWEVWLVQGLERNLKDLAGRVFSQQLDRDKPLWEVWLVEGLDDDSFAVLSKTHHALVDGI